ncbi:hypothetical protein [Rhodoplanes azumiensis]|uniref:Uncharacterized protein n=1 Tax=Rhodoplanes azumiensis TaxID=1897628 RepID=A0ABW5AF80_9BRAD
MSTIVRTPARLAIAAAVTLATVTGALAAPRQQTQAPRDVYASGQAWGAASVVPFEAYGAYASAPQGWGSQSTGYTSLSAPNRHDQAKGNID